MKKWKVFINGESGTTGLKIHSRLSGRDDIELISLPAELRRDHQSIKMALNESDVSFLCLPDEAAIEAVAMIENPNTVIIDTSTAHRTLDGWSYGFPELSESHSQAIETSKRIAVPGCHASGFAALVYPLVEAGVLPKDTKLSCFSLTGYSGGGKKMIAEYEDKSRDVALDSPRIYAITQQHKHLREMKAVAGLDFEPHFTPVVADYYCGMLVSIPIFADMISCGTAELREIYKKRYNDKIMRYCESIDEGGFIAGGAAADMDYMNISVGGGEERITLYAQFDNLGKGASGAAVECMNIVMGKDRESGLTL